jgi:DNA-binding transcriptional LysR family regulator
MDQSLVARRIGEFYLISCASPAYLKRNGTPAHPSELDDGHYSIRYMSARNGKPLTFNMHKDGEVVEPGGRHQLSVNDSNAGVTAALAGLGVLHTLSFLVQDHISNGTLELLFSGWCTEPKPIYVVYPPNRHLSNKVRVFVDWIADLFARHDLIQRKTSLPDAMCSSWAVPAAALPRTTQTLAAPDHAEKTIKYAITA